MLAEIKQPGSRQPGAMLASQSPNGAALPTSCSSCDFMCKCLSQACPKCSSWRKKKCCMHVRRLQVPLVAFLMGPAVCCRQICHHGKLNCTRSNTFILWFWKDWEKSEKLQFPLNTSQWLFLISYSNNPTVCFPLTTTPAQLDGIFWKQESQEGSISSIRQCQYCFYF